MNQENKNCSHCKKDFVITNDDLDFYQKIKVPSPAWCPQCRNMRRILYRNFKTLYKRNSDLSGESMISMYAPDAPYVVYRSDEWWSDSWDAMDYGMNVDLNKNFFTQLDELFHKTPRANLIQVNCKNSEYANMAMDSNNCYLCFGCVENEDCDYGHLVWNCRDTLDNLYIFKSESCYECVDCLSCNKLFYSQECESCADSIGLYDCRSCTDCIGCVGLIGKSYYVFNQKVSKEEYKEIKSSLFPLTQENIKMILDKVEELRRSLPQRSFFGSHNNDVSGNHVYYAHNVHNSFDVKSGENSKYAYTVKSAIDSYDVSFSIAIENCYEGLNCFGSNLLSCHNCVNLNDVSYSEFCHNSHDLFGCFGLRNKSYCILNKQYEKEDYFEIKEKIISKMIEEGEYGTFFPTWMSPFAYNESIVNEYMPLAKEEALGQGFKWRDDIPFTHGQGTIDFDSLPDEPVLYSEDLTKEIFTCISCTKNYKLIDREITFYKRMNITIPQNCFNCRHQTRMDKRLKRVLIDANCKNCGKDIKTAYDKKDQEKYNIFCEKCYQQEVV